MAYGWKPLRPSYRLDCVLSIIVPLLTSVIEGLGCYYLVIFPLFLSCAWIAKTHPRKVKPAVLASLITQVTLIALFSTGHPGVV